MYPLFLAVAWWLLRKKHETLSSNKCLRPNNPTLQIYNNKYICNKSSLFPFFPLLFFLSSTSVRHHSVVSGCTLCGPKIWLIVNRGNLGRTVETLTTHLQHGSAISLCVLQWKLQFPGKAHLGKSYFLNISWIGFLLRCWFHIHVVNRLWMYNSVITRVSQFRNILF